MLTNRLSRVRNFAVLLVSFFLMFIGLLVQGAQENCHADLTFHPVRQNAEIVNQDRELYEHLEFPRDSGVEVHVKLTPTFTIRERYIRSIAIREVQTDRRSNTDAAKALGLAEKKLKGRIEHSMIVVSFRLDDEGARSFGSFAQRHIGKTFAVKFNSVIIGLPTFLGSFERLSYEFDLIGVSEDDLAQLKKLSPLIKDERNKTKQ